MGNSSTVRTPMLCATAPHTDLAKRTPTGRPIRQPSTVITIACHEDRDPDVVRRKPTARSTPKSAPAAPNGDDQCMPNRHDAERDQEQREELRQPFDLLELLDLGRWRGISDLIAVERFEAGADGVTCARPKLMASDWNASPPAPSVAYRFGMHQRPVREGIPSSVRNTA